MVDTPSYAIDFHAEVLRDENISACVNSCGAIGCLGMEQSSSRADAVISACETALDDLQHNLEDGDVYDDSAVNSDVGMDSSLSVVMDAQCDSVEDAALKHVVLKEKIEATRNSLLDWTGHIKAAYDYSERENTECNTIIAALIDHATKIHNLKWKCKSTCSDGMSDQQAYMVIRLLELLDDDARLMAEDTSRRQAAASVAFNELAMELMPTSERLNDKLHAMIIEHATLDKLVREGV